MADSRLRNEAILSESYQPAHLVTVSPGRVSAPPKNSSSRQFLPTFSRGGQEPIAEGTIAAGKKDREGLPANCFMTLKVEIHYWMGYLLSYRIVGGMIVSLNIVKYFEHQKVVLGRL